MRSLKLQRGGAEKFINQQRNEVKLNLIQLLFRSRFHPVGVIEWSREMSRREEMFQSMTIFGDFPLPSATLSRYY